mgnify:CR=1 FL=1
MIQSVSRKEVVTNNFSQLEALYKGKLNSLSGNTKVLTLVPNLKEKPSNNSNYDTVMLEPKIVNPKQLSNSIPS